MIFKNSKDKNLNKNLGKSQRYTAFTLAEVLITLTIIGVVAALTVPALMNNVQDYQFKKAWKKEYSTLSQVINQIYADEGVTYNSTDYPTYDYMARYFCKIQNRMKTTATNLNCTDEDSIPADHNAWPGSGKYYWKLRSWKTKNGITGDSNGAYDNLAFINADGATIQFNCTNELLVDVNGTKGPNIVGRDIFGVNIAWKNPSKLYFFSMPGEDAHLGSCGSTGGLWGITTSNYVSDCDSDTGSGWGCSAKYILED